MADIIKMLEQEEIARLSKNIPDFAPGDTVVVGVNVVEGTRKRVQAYEGVVIAKRNRGLNSSFIVRKISSGEAVLSPRAFRQVRAHQGKAAEPRQGCRRIIFRHGSHTKPHATRSIIGWSWGFCLR